MVLVKIFWPPLHHIFILLNIKELKLFLVPSLLGQPLLAMPLLTDTDMVTDMDSTTPSLLPPPLPQRLPLSSTPDTTVILMPTDTVLADTMADMVDTPAV